MRKNLQRGSVSNTEMQPGEFVVCCGGIKPIIIPEDEEKEEEYTE